MRLDSVYVVGGGGHAKVVIASLREIGYRVLGVFDDDPSKLGSTIFGIRVIGPASIIEDFSGKGQFVLAIGDNDRRRTLADAHHKVKWVTVVHPTAYVHSSVQLGFGTVVFAGAVIQPGTVIGKHSIINTAATVDHDCSIADFVHLAPGSHIAGGVTVGAGSMLGIGSSVIPNRRIGAGVVVGAGAVVINDIEDGMTVVGVPARSIEDRDRGSRGE